MSSQCIFQKVFKLKLVDLAYSFILILLFFMIGTAGFCSSSQTKKIPMTTTTSSTPETETSNDKATEPSKNDLENENITEPAPQAGFKAVKPAQTPSKDEIYKNNLETTNQKLDELTLYGFPGYKHKTDNETKVNWIAGKFPKLQLIIQEMPENYILEISGHSNLIYKLPKKYWGGDIAGARAQWVKNILIMKGISPNKLVSQSKKQSELLVQEVVPQNRRVTFSIIEK